MKKTIMVEPLTGKPLIRVFPDYCSSGLWESYSEGGGANMDESEVAHCIPAHLMIALKYWHMVWEDHIEYWATKMLVDDRVKRHVLQWEQDGITIVAAMNACQDEFNFVYIGDNF